MSLVEAAKEIASNDLVELSDYATTCYFCGGFVIGYGWDSRPADTVAYQGYDHYADCPWLSLPRIVAALEAAERLVDNWGDGSEVYTVYTDYPSYRALVSALATGQEEERE